MHYGRDFIDNTVSSRVRFEALVVSHSHLESNFLPSNKKPVYTGVSAQTSIRTVAKNAHIVHVNKVTALRDLGTVARLLHSFDLEFLHFSSNKKHGKHEEE